MATTIYEVLDFIKAADESAYWHLGNISASTLVGEYEIVVTVSENDCDLLVITDFYCEKVLFDIHLQDCTTQQAVERIEAYIINVLNRGLL